VRAVFDTGDEKGFVYTCGSRPVEFLMEDVPKDCIRTVRDTLNFLVKTRWFQNFYESNERIVQYGGYMFVASKLEGLALQQARRLKCTASAPDADILSLLPACKGPSPGDWGKAPPNELLVALKWPECWDDLLYAETHPDEAVAMLTALRPADLQHSKSACDRAEALLQSSCERIRAAAQSLFYVSDSDETQVSLQKRLEYAISTDIDEFIVFWDEQCKQFGFIEEPRMEEDLQEIIRAMASRGIHPVMQAAPHCQRTSIGSHKFVVQYYLFGEKPSERERVATTLTGEHLCATMVYARCIRLDGIDPARRRSLLQSAPGSGSVGLSGAREFIFASQVPQRYNQCDVITTGLELNPKHALLVLTKESSATRIPLARLEPLPQNTYDPSIVVPPHWRASAQRSDGKISLKPGIGVYTSGLLVVCLAPPLTLSPAETSEPVQAELGPKKESEKESKKESEKESEKENEIRRLNAEARAKKLALRRGDGHAAAQRTSRREPPTNDGAARCSTQSGLSNNARRRMEKKEKQRMMRENREMNKWCKEEEQCMEIRTRVERLKLEDGTVVKEHVPDKTFHRHSRRSPKATCAEDASGGRSQVR
jgi:hypothetical protein